MKYSDGTEVIIGDKVVADKSEGVVVCVIDSQQFSADHPKEQWSYLKKGMMVDTVEMGLVHYPEVSEDVSLVERER